MKSLKKPPILIAFLSMCLLAFCFNTSNDDPEKNKKIINTVRKSLNYLHYDTPEIDDTFSEKTFDRYFDYLDPFKRYFLQSDIAHFKKSRRKLDDYYKTADLNFYYATIDTLYRRVSQIEKMNKAIYLESFDFTLNEELNLNEEKIDFVNKTKWKSLWRKHAKYNIMQEVYDLQQDSLNAKKPFNALVKEAKETVKDNDKDFFRRFKERKRKDWLSIYINSFTEGYDPHTTYFSPKEKEDFEISISGQLEGIGARLQDKKGYSTIVELIVGGPAWKSKELEPEDQIIKVAQDGEEPVNIVGMLLDDAIRLIRGKKGSKVTLTIKSKNGEIKQVVLIRDVIEYGDSFAKSTIIENADGKKYGLLHLPEFYVNFNNKKNGRDASDDVAKEIKSLKREGVEGIIFDVRNNGGGSLSEVVEIVGHFIDKGPVVQVKRYDGKKEVLKDLVKGLLWDLPLVVLTNELSASASEILAAALQDYQRAVIIGSKQTYGKGTVQSIMPLDRFSFSDDELGAIKLTIQKFYRINGGSTQRKGVESDIVIPSKYMYRDINEGAKDNAMKWDQIPAANYRKWNQSIHLNSIKNKSLQRLRNNQHLKQLDEMAKWLKASSEHRTVSLNYETYKKELNQRREKAEQLDSLSKYQTDLKLIPSEHDLVKFAIDTALKIKREDWYQNLSQDIVVDEAIQVLKDLK